MKIAARSPIKTVHVLCALVIAFSVAGAPQSAEASWFSSVKKAVTKTLPKPVQKAVAAKDKLAGSKAKIVGKALQAHPKTHMKAAQLGGITAIKGAQLGGAAIQKGTQFGALTAQKGTQAGAALGVRAAQTASMPALVGATGVGTALASAPPPAIKKEENKPQVLPGNPAGGVTAWGDGVTGIVASGGSAGPGSPVICVFNCGGGGGSQQFTDNAY